MCGRRQAAEKLQKMCSSADGRRQDADGAVRTRPVVSYHAPAASKMNSLTSIQQKSLLTPDIHYLQARNNSNKQFIKPQKPRSGVPKRLGISGHLAV